MSVPSSLSTNSIDVTCSHSDGTTKGVKSKGAIYLVGVSSSIAVL